MPGPLVNLYAIPTGGAIRLEMPEYLIPPSGVTFMSLSIAASGATGLSAFSQIYSGMPLPQYLDCGDIYPAPLDPTFSYVYQVTDDRGTTQTSPVQPAWALETLPDQLTQIIIRLFQGMVNSVPLPQGVSRTFVTTQMPANGWQAMPFIVVNLDLVQQTDTQVGEDVPNPGLDNRWTLFVNAKRMWRVTIMCQAAEERDFYRDTSLAAYRAMIATVFTPLGYNVRHSFQAASYTDAREWEGHAPGFYGADLMLEMDGIFPITIVAGYGMIEKITSTATFPDGVIQEADTKPG